MEDYTGVKRIDPEFRRREKDALVRRHRKVIYLNDRELHVLEDYCRRYRITSLAAFFRATVMEEVMRRLDEGHPKLF